MSLVDDLQRVSLNNILPAGLTGDGADQFLSLSDIIVNEHKLGSPDWEAGSSREYSICIPIDLEAAIESNVVGLLLKVTNTSPSVDGVPSPGFSFKAYFREDIVNMVDTGESDLATLLEVVRSKRRSITPADGVPGNRSPVDFSQAQSGNALDVFGYSSSDSSRDPVGMLLDGRPKDPFAAGDEAEVRNSFDFFLKPPRFISDGSNIRGSSVLGLKEKLRVEEEEIAGTDFLSNRATALSALESDTSGRSVPEGFTKVDYVSSVIPVRRVVRVSTNTLADSRVRLEVTPILEDPLEMSTDPGALPRPSPHGQRPSRPREVSQRFLPTKLSFDHGIQSQYHDLSSPTGNPSVRILSQKAGNVRFLIEKKDPFLTRGLLTIEYHNPHLPENEYPPVSKSVNFNGFLPAVCEFDQVINSHPVSAIYTFFSMHSETEEIVSSITGNLSSFEGSMSYILPEVNNAPDFFTLNATSTMNGVDLTIVGSVPRSRNVTIFREDLGSADFTKDRKRIVGSLTTIADGQSLTDRRVISGRTYRYYIKYELPTTTKPFVLYENQENFPRQLGRNARSFVSYRSTTDVTLRYQKPYEVTGIDISDPSFSSDSEGNPVISMKVSFNPRPEDLVISDLEEIAGSIGVEGAETFDSTRAYTSKIPVLIVERMNRQTGDVSIVGVTALRSNDAVSVQDKDIYRLSNFARNIQGRFMYTFRLSKPTVAALQNAKIPIRSDNPTALEEATLVNGLKYTSELFNRSGIVPASSFLKSPKLFDILTSFDTGERIYKEYDPSPADQGSTSFTITLERSGAGYNILWSSPPDLKASAYCYMVFKIRSGTSRYIGMIKECPDRDSYKFSDMPRFSFSSISTDASYYVLPVTVQGDYLEASNTVSTLSLKYQGIAAIARSVAFMPSSIIQTDSRGDFTLNGFFNV